MIGIFFCVLSLLDGEISVELSVVNKLEFIVSCLSCLCNVFRSAEPMIVDNGLTFVILALCFYINFFLNENKFLMCLENFSQISSLNCILHQLLATRQINCTLTIKLTVT